MANTGTTEASMTTQTTIHRLTTFVSTYTDDPDWQDALAALADAITAEDAVATRAALDALPDDGCGAAATQIRQRVGEWLEAQDAPSQYVVSTGEDADEWSRHADLVKAREEAELIASARHEPTQVWSVDDYDRIEVGGPGPLFEYDAS